MGGKKKGRKGQAGGPSGAASDPQASTSGQQLPVGLATQPPAAQSDFPVLGVPTALPAPGSGPAGPPGLTAAVVTAPGPPGITATGAIPKRVPQLQVAEVEKSVQKLQISQGSGDTHGQMSAGAQQVARSSGSGDAKTPVESHGRGRGRGKDRGSPGAFQGAGTGQAGDKKSDGSRGRGRGRGSKGAVEKSTTEVTERKPTLVGSPSQPMPPPTIVSTPSQPMPSKPMPSKPMPSKPIPAQPMPSQPVPAQPMPAPMPPPTIVGMSSVPQSGGPSTGRTTTPMILPPRTPSAGPHERDIQMSPDEYNKMKKIGLPTGRKGSAGRPIRLDINYIPVTFQQVQIHHYDVDFKPDLPKFLLKLAVKKLNELPTFKNVHLAFDGRKNIYTRTILNITGTAGFSVEVFNTESQSDKEFFITIQHVHSCHLKDIMEHMDKGSSLSIPQEGVQALDIVLRHMRAFQFTQVARSFFSPPQGQVIYLGGGMELWHGHFQSLRLGWKPFLNVDVAHKAFPFGGPVLHYMADVLGGFTYPQHPKGPLDRIQISTLAKSIKNLKVEYTRLGCKRSYRVNDVKGPCNKETFDNEGKKVTIAQYFEQQYSTTLQFPDLPCLHVGSKEKTIYIPLELCSIKAGQPVQRKLDEGQTASMIKHTAVNPSARKKMILDSLRKCNFNQDPLLSEFGVSVGDTMTRLEGRVLPAPMLTYGQNESEKEMPRDGVWNMRSHKFLEASVLENWLVYNLGRTNNDVICKFVDGLIHQGRGMGMSISKPLTIMQSDGQPRTVCRDFADFFEKKIKMVFCVLPPFGNISEIYATIKKVAEVQIGILTQCVKSQNVLKNSPATVSNILLKINSKLGGTNNFIDKSIRPAIFDLPVIVFGADVTHPSPDQRETSPSVAAVCGSLDPRVSKFMTQIRIQKGGVEIIEDMKNVVISMLKEFRATSGHIPKRILFYRDGVSEGQFDQVLQHEFNAIRQACKSLSDTYQPPITFIVVQKRHHTRFFPTDPKDECGRSRNVPPGTIVDHTITFKPEMNFYMVSHQGIQGTSRPTKYHVLWDDSNLSADSIELLSYYLCHTFVRCTRSVSYPAPTYYAHLAAFRGRTFTGDRSTLQDVFRLEDLKKQIAIQPSLTKGNPMHYV